MYFDYRGFSTFLRHALFPERGVPYPLTPRRFAMLAGFLPLFALVEASARAGFLYDDVLFRAYRRQPVDRPVFIVGNPRSGTTYLQRVLAKDHHTFMSMKLWEILFAPSITQRWMARAFLQLDGKDGERFRSLVKAIQRRIIGRNRMHKSGLFVAEEDQYYMVHIWSTLVVWHFAGMLKEGRPYTYFDTAMSQARKDKIMTFYKRGVQRHLYARWDPQLPDRHYLSKNPSASPKIDALYRHFPSARILYLVRNPLDMIPSMVSILDYTWELLADPPERYMCRDGILEMAYHWYTYPLARLERAPAETYRIVRYEDLTANVEETVTPIYDQFGFTMGPGYPEYLRKETERERAYKSKHHYDMEKMGLSGEQIVRDFKPIFERFDFDTRGYAEA